MASHLYKDSYNPRIIFLYFSCTFVTERFHDEVYHDLGKRLYFGAGQKTFR
ncbi:Uncharacterised protein [Porphyromonas cangingivalis]|nr:Uncharacterised protein [Porphyromonas cangingivalis]